MRASGFTGVDTLTLVSVICQIWIFFLGRPGSSVWLPVWGPDEAVRYCQQAEIHPCGAGQVHRLDICHESERQIKIIHKTLIVSVVLQRSIRHPPWQGGLCGLQKWAGVHRLQGKERPFDGGECRLHSQVCYVSYYKHLMRFKTFICRNPQNPRPDDVTTMISE